MTAVLEDIKSVDISEWLTLNTASAPTKLAPGQASDMNNVWVDEKPGSVVTANGLVKVGVIPSGLPVTFCFNFFKTSDGSQKFIVSDGITVWATTDFVNFTQIVTSLAAGFQLRAAVIWDKLWMVNGSNHAMTWDGTTLVSMDGTGSTPNVPIAKYITTHDERVWLGHISGARSQVFFSAVSDSSGDVIAPDNSAAWPSDNELQIGQGNADFLTGLMEYRGYLYIFKQYTIWRLVGYDEYTYAVVKTRASTGTRFNESLAILDDLVYLIGIDGIYIFDGEETSRVSDIIDPNDASQAVFGFDNLQQPLLNNLFWQVADEGDWNDGTIVPPNITVTDVLTLAPTDSTSTDFSNGALLQNIDAVTNPGQIQLSVVSNNLALGQRVQWNSYNGSGGAGAQTSGSPSNLVDGNDSTTFTINNPGVASSTFIMVDLPAFVPINQININRSNTPYNGQQYHVYVNNTNNKITVPSSGPVTFTGFVSVGTMTLPTGTNDGGVIFPKTQCSQILLLWFYNKYTTIGEIQAIGSEFATTGKFISKTFDYTVVPNSFEMFAATVVNSSVSFFTQSSADGSTWDSEVSVSNGGPINSTVRRYLRWGAYLSTPDNGFTSPQIGPVYLMALYQSEIKDAGANVFAWGAYESNQSPNGGDIEHFYRAASTVVGVGSASWVPIVPGAVPNTAVTNRYIQFKIEFSASSSTSLPIIIAVTINWILTNGTGVNTLQNVGSFVWRNRYWLSAAQKGSGSNDVILVRGKKTYNNPWQKKDWSLLSFARYQDEFYGGSSIDGSIYQLDSGYSKDSDPIDAYFVTGDFVFAGFSMEVIEILCETDRLGNYPLVLSVSKDGGSTWTPFSVDLSPQPSGMITYIKRLNCKFICDRFRVKVEINGADQPFAVHNIRVNVRLTQARGSIL